VGQGGSHNAGRGTVIDLYDNTCFFGGFLAVGDDWEEAEIRVGGPGIVGIWFDVGLVDDGEVDEEWCDCAVV
jgi:hypothetical protein